MHYLNNLLNVGCGVYVGYRIARALLLRLAEWATKDVEGPKPAPEAKQVEVLPLEQVPPDTPPVWVELYGGLQIPGYKVVCPKCKKLDKQSAFDDSQLPTVHVRCSRGHCWDISMEYDS